VSTRDGAAPRVAGSGISRLISKDLRPYVYRGRDTEPDPREIAEAIRARLAAQGITAPESEAAP
jgi:hypothetical protein